MFFKYIRPLRHNLRDRVMRASQTTIFWEGEARSESGELVAKAIGTFRARSPKT